MKWLIAILIFSLLIIFHEFGHFIFAKINGVEVEEMSLGYGPRLLSTTFHGTRYSLKLILFGGSCLMKGMYEEYADESDHEPVAKVPEEGSFESVSLGRRASIIFAGPFFNFLLAFIGAIIVISVVGYDPPEILNVEKSSPAAEAGLTDGDTITNFMGDGVEIGRDVSTWFLLNNLDKDEAVTMSFRHDGQEKTVTFTPSVLTRYMLGLTYTIESETAKIQSVSDNSPLASAGIAAGDVITEINGTKITTAKSLSEYFSDHPMDGSSVHIVYERDGLSYDADVTPVKNESVDLGFSYNLGRVNTSALGVLKYSLIEIRYWIVTTVRSLGALFTGRFSVNDLSGPVGIVDVVGTTYEETKSEGALMTWMNMINLVILLSANLGVMNLLPIPAIDGGRLLFIIIEAIRGKPMNKKVESTVQLVAVALLMMLMVYVMYHDITKILAP